MQKLNTRAIRTQPPIGVILTMGTQVIEANNGLLRFIRHFDCCLSKGDYWLQKARMAPKEDIAQVYIVIQNRIWCRVFYGGYERQGTTVFMRTGEKRSFPWPHMILAGPIERAPYKIAMRGFQGFRYIYEPLW